MEEALASASGEEDTPVLVNFRPLLIATILSSIALVLGTVRYVFSTRWLCCDGIERCKKSIFAKCHKGQDTTTADAMSQDGGDDIEGEMGERSVMIELENQSGNFKGGEEEDDNHGGYSEEKKMSKSRCCTSTTYITVFTILHWAAKVIITAVNITYLALLGFTEESPFTTSAGGQTSSNELAFASNYITSLVFVYEAVILVGVPIVSLPGYFCRLVYYKLALKGGRYNVNEENETDKPKIIEYLECWRWAAVVVAFGFAPFGFTDLFFRGGLWLIYIPVKIILFAMTLAAAVIAGMRFFLGVFCWTCCECACSVREVNIRSFRPYLLNIPGKMIPLALKFSVSSASLATYFAVVGFITDDAFRVIYLILALMRGVSALFSLGYTAALVRWVVLKGNDQLNDSRTSLILGLLNHFQPHVHVTFVVDTITFGGLLAMNFALINEMNQHGQNLSLYFS